MFDINVKYRMRRYLPWFKRKTRTLAIVDVIAFVIKAINNELVAFRKRKRELTSVTAQIIHLEYYLNVLESYDPFLKRIYIENLADIEYFYLRRIPEERPKYIYRKSEYAGLSNVSPRYYLKRQTEFTSQLDFIVWVPVSITFDENLMRSRIDTYNLAGKTYEIRTF